MADTLQIVSWSLKRSCQFRYGNAWEYPEQTAEQLADFKTLTAAMSDCRVVDDICVTSWSSVCPFKTDKGKTDYKKSVAIPFAGFRVAERFEKYGRIESVFATCGNCEANAMANPKSQLAGCHGHLSIYPQSTELEEALQQSLAELGSATRFFECFQNTNPIWYGLWIESPLRREQVCVLRPVLERAFSDDDDERSGICQFLRALDIAVQFEIPLHVRLAPLGHTDFGWYTVFPHCPRCKANAPVGRWKEQYTRETYACQVCGHHFVPDDTHSQEEMNWDFEADSLEKIFGFEEFGNFVRRYAESQGYTPEEAEAAWEEELNSREIRERAAAANRERWKSKPSKEEVVEFEKRVERLEVKDKKVCPCPECGKPLRTHQAKQCFECGADWH